MIIHEIPYVPKVEPVNTSSKHEKSFEEELRKHMRGQVKKDVRRKEIVVNHICKQLDRMSAIDIQQFLLEIDRRRKYGGPWGSQEGDYVNRLEKELRGCLR